MEPHKSLLLLFLWRILFGQRCLGQTLNGSQEDEGMWQVHGRLNKVQEREFKFLIIFAMHTESDPSSIANIDHDADPFSINVQFEHDSDEDDDLFWIEQPSMHKGDVASWPMIGEQVLYRFRKRAFAFLDRMPPGPPKTAPSGDLMTPPPTAYASDSYDVGEFKLVMTWEERRPSYMTPSSFKWSKTKPGPLNAPILQDGRVGKGSPTLQKVLEENLRPGLPFEARSGQDPYGVSARFTIPLREETEFYYRVFWKNEWHQPQSHSPSQAQWPSRDSDLTAFWIALGISVDSSTSGGQDTSDGQGTSSQRFGRPALRIFRHEDRRIVGNPVQVPLDDPDIDKPTDV
ncbi:MAG: hypothetical protein M1831_000785 [Alyxoria varia]|nr:MAG: hypothetical protein M1831_000785 [Alyxoria varia]